MNFIREILIIIVIINFDKFLIIYIIIICFFRRAYSLYLFSYVYHGKNNYDEGVYYVGIIKEFLVLIIHFFPLIIFILNLIIFI